MADLVASGDRRKMITVYVIESLKKEFRYVGITNDLGNRLYKHSSGFNKSTKAYTPYRVIYKEDYQDYKEARIREKFLKSGVGRKFLDELP